VKGAYGAVVGTAASTAGAVAGAEGAAVGTTVAAGGVATGAAALAETGTVASGVAEGAATGTETAVRVPVQAQLAQAQDLRPPVGGGASSLAGAGDERAAEAAFGPRVGPATPEGAAATEAAGAQRVPQQVQQQQGLFRKSPSKAPLSDAQKYANLKTSILASRGKGATLTAAEERLINKSYIERTGHFAPEPALPPVLFRKASSQRFLARRCARARRAHMAHEYRPRFCAAPILFSVEGFGEIVVFRYRSFGSGQAMREAHPSKMFAP
jgi:hypothetical protein